MNDPTRDERMNEFDIFIDPDRMKTLFQQRLPSLGHGGRLIDRCRIGYARLKTYQKSSASDRSSLSICYHLEITDPSDGRPRAEILYAKAFLGSRSWIELEKMAVPSSKRADRERECIHLPDLDLIIWIFPNDPVLRHLPKCIQPEAVKQYLPYDTLPTGLDGPADLVNITSEVVHYRPEVRCTTRYRLQWGGPDNPKERVLFGKTFNDDRGKEIHQRMETLWKISSDHPESFMVAQPLAYHEEIKTVWQAGLKGDPFVDVIDQTNDRPLLEAVGGGLARFHKSDLSSIVKITLDDHLGEIKKKLAKLIHAFPRFAGSLRSIEHDLVQRVHQLTPVPERIIHGDFTVQQLLVCEGRIAFFDFDEFAIGDPTQDVANFIVDLHFRSFDRSLVEEMKVVFSHAYRRRVDWPLSADRLFWHLQIQFITKAYRIYIQQKPGMEKEIKEIIVLAQEGMVLEKV